MTKQGTRLEVNTFIKGLMTEASPLNFPANASADEVNFELLRDGTRKRRKGLDFEEGYNHVSASTLNNNYDTRVAKTFIWENVGGDVNVAMLVVQVGNILRIHDLANASPSSEGAIITSLWMNFNAEQSYSFAEANGKLMVAGGGTHVAQITHIGGSSFSVDYVPIRVRDIWGIQETDATTETDPANRPTSLTSSHEYNLLNQGWAIPRKNKVGTVVNPITQFFTDLSKYPSNQDAVYTGLQFQPVQGTTDPYERMYTNLYIESLGLGNNSAKGYFVIDLHNRGTSRTASVNLNKGRYPEAPAGKAYPTDAMSDGARVVASYAGRVFYSGFSGAITGGDQRSPNLADHIFFSKLIKSDSDINECYQVGDPTSRENSDVVDTDGGFLRISGAQRIVELRVLGKALLVFATNGVWVVTGGADYGFSASNFKVTKVTSFGCVAPNSLVEVNGELLYWGAEGIYKIGPSQMGDLVAADFSAVAINTYYDNITAEAKSKATGIYDAVEKKIRWVFRVGALFTPGSYAVELVFDTLLGAFYQNKVEHYNNTEMVGIWYYTKVGVKYLVLSKSAENILYTFAGYKDTEFVDWKSVDGVGIDAKAYLLTGAFTAGDSAVMKQAPYVVMHFIRTETSTDGDGVPMNQSSCLMKVQWDWSNNPMSKKFSNLVETYRHRLPTFAEPNSSYSNGFDTVVSRSKIRGRGRALTLYFETSPKKDCHILGWSLTINGNAIA